MSDDMAVRSSAVGMAREARAMTTTSLEDDPVLAELVRRLVGAFDPDRIHLFGSKARGTGALTAITT